MSTHPPVDPKVLQQRVQDIIRSAMVSVSGVETFDRDVQGQDEGFFNWKRDILRGSLSSARTILQRIGDEGASQHPALAGAIGKASRAVDMALGVLQGKRRTGGPGAGSPPAGVKVRPAGQPPLSTRGQFDTTVSAAAPPRPTGRPAAGTTAAWDGGSQGRRTQPGIAPPHTVPQQARVPGQPVTLRGIGPARPPARTAKRESEALREALQRLDGEDPNGIGEGEFESGWDLALRRSAGAQALSPQHASAARKRIRAAAAPAFAAALDRAVDAKLLTQFAARHSGGVDARKLRAAYAETANRAFAAEFVRLVGGRPPASAEDIALGAIIAVAIAQTTARYPIVPPAAVAPMAVLVHRTLRPRLPELARMAAVIAVAAGTAAPKAAPAAAAPAREMAW